MTQEEQMIHLGNAAEETLKNEAFATIVNQLINNSFNSFVGTEPGDSDARTAAYYQYKAIREVVDTMQQHVSVRDEINGRNKETPEEE